MKLYLVLALVCMLFAAIGFVGFIASLLTFDVGSAGVMGLACAFFIYTAVTLGMMSEE